MERTRRMGLRSMSSSEDAAINVGTVSSVARRAGEGERRRGAAGRGGGGGGERGREEGERRGRGRGGRGRREGKGERSAGREGERQGKPVKDLRTGAAAAALPAAPAGSRPPPLRAPERCPRPRRCRPLPRAGTGREPFPPPGEVPAEVPNAADGPGRQRCRHAASPAPRTAPVWPRAPRTHSTAPSRLGGMSTGASLHLLALFPWANPLRTAGWRAPPWQFKMPRGLRSRTQRLKLTSTQNPGLALLSRSCRSLRKM